MKLPTRKVTDPKFLPIGYEIGSYLEFQAALGDVVELDPPVVPQSLQPVAAPAIPAHEVIPRNLNDQKGKKEPKASEMEKNGVLSSIAPKNPDGLVPKKPNTNGDTTP